MDDSPYRSPTQGRSPALEQLIAGAPIDGPAPAPRQTRRLIGSRAQLRYELAVGAQADRPRGRLLASVFAGIVSLNILARMRLATAADQNSIAFVLCLCAAIVIWTAIAWSKAGQRRSAAIRAELAWAEHLAFPVTGYADWLISDRTFLDVHLRASLAASTMVRAAAAVDPTLEIDAIGDCAFRIEIPARLWAGRPPERYGDVPLLHVVFDRLLMPLHNDIGIERIAMGGTFSEG